MLETNRRGFLAAAVLGAGALFVPSPLTPGTRALATGLAGPVDSGPTAPPNRALATAGKSARGMASTIAQMSTRKDMITTGLVAMNRKPSVTERNPSVVCADLSGGSGGNRSAEYSAAVNSTESMPYAYAYPWVSPTSTPASWSSSTTGWNRPT